MSCSITDKNLAIYFQEIIPTIFPSKEQNKILFGTTNASPSYIANNRVWNFVCNGTFIDNKIIITFDATKLLKKCNYIINFEGNIYGQLSLNNKDFQLTKYVKFKLLKNQEKNYAIQFLIRKPECLNIKNLTTFYFNIFLNDSSCQVKSTVGGCNLCFGSAYLNIYANPISYDAGSDGSISVWLNGQWIIYEPSNGSNQITISGEIPTGTSFSFDILNYSLDSNVENIGFYVGDGSKCSAGGGNGSITVPKATSNGLGNVNPAIKLVKIYYGNGQWNLVLP